MTETQQLIYKYPPDLQKSYRHRLATRINKGISKDHVNNEQCECCERKIGEEQVSSNCCYSPTQLAYFGPGIPLFFHYLSNVIILLITLCIIFAGFSIYTNIVGQYCTGSTGTTGNCQKSIFNTLSIVNKRNKIDYLSIQNYILLGFVVASLFVLQYFRYNFRKVQDQCDDCFDTPSDYAIILRRLPPQIQTKDIQQMVNERRGFLTAQQKLATDNLRVQKIVLSYYLSQYVQTKQKNVQQLKNYIKQKKQAEFKPQPLPHPSKSASIAIIIFSKQQSKQFFKFKPNICQKLGRAFCAPCVPLSDFRVKQNNIGIQRAPQPDDIIWRNAGISLCGGITRKSVFTFLGIILLFAGGCAQYGLALAQNSVTDNTGKFILGLCSSLLVTITNAIIQQFLYYTTSKERVQTITQQNSILMMKLSLFQFFNAGVFIVLANVLANFTNFSLESQMSYQITLIMILNAFTPNITTFILYYFNIIGKVKVIISTQKEANQTYQLPVADVSQKYSLIIKTLWLTAFYAPLVPIVVPISIIGLTLNYWIQKLLYGGSYKAPNMLSDTLNDDAMQLLQYTSLILCIGELLIYLYFVQFHIDLIPNYWGIPIYVSIGLSILNLLLPMESINKALFKIRDDNIVTPPYSAIENDFEVTYQMTNPAYQSKRKRKRDKFLWKALFGNSTELPLLSLGFNNTNNDNMFGPSSGKSQMNPLLAGLGGNNAFNQPMHNFGGNGNTFSPPMISQPINNNNINIQMKEMQGGQSGQQSFMQMLPPGQPPMMQPNQQMFPPGQPPMMQPNQKMFPPGQSPMMQPNQQMFLPGQPPMMMEPNQQIPPPVKAPTYRYKRPNNKKSENPLGNPFSAMLNNQNNYHI